MRLRVRAIRCRLARACTRPSFLLAGRGLLEAGGSKALTFKGQPGNAVRQIHFRSPNLIFDGINVDAQMAMLGGSDGALFENGGEPFTFKNGSIGNVADQKGALVDGAGIVFDNVLFHDVVLKTAACIRSARTSRCRRG